jgi:hypothetical protein
MAVMNVMTWTCKEPGCRFKSSDPEAVDRHEDRERHYQFHISTKSYDVE